MPKFRELSSPEKFEARYKELRDQILQLKFTLHLDSDESTVLVSDPAAARKNLERRIEIIGCYLNPLNEWRDTLRQELRVLRPLPARISEIETDIDGLNKQIQSLEEAKNAVKSALAIKLSSMAPGSHSDHQNNFPDEPEDKPRSAFGCC